MAKPIGVLGAGPGGSILAANFAKIDRKVILVEAAEERRKQITENGLEIVGLDTFATKGVEVVPSIAALAGVELDAFFICVKTWTLRIILPELAKALAPETLVVSFQNGVGPEDEVARFLPQEHVARLASAEPLAVRWLSTLTERELVLYDHVVRVAHELLAACLSAATIVPGVTTVQDLEWAYWQRCADRGLSLAFKPFFSLVRREDVRAAPPPRRPTRVRPRRRPRRSRRRRLRGRVGRGRRRHPCQRVPCRKRRARRHTAARRPSLGPGTLEAVPAASRLPDGLCGS